MLAWFSVLLLSFALYLSHGKSIRKCATVQGVWYNQFGSELTLYDNKDGTLDGKYCTSWEVELGDAVDCPGIVQGAAPKYRGAPFELKWDWSEGQSIMIGTGQCAVCEGHEKLLTTSLLYSQSSKSNGELKLSPIHRTFTRYPKKVGPEEANVTHVPERPLYDTRSSEKSVKPLVKMSNLPKPATPFCNLNGIWYNEFGSELKLKQDNTSIIQVEYQTAVERSLGAAGNIHVIGYYNYPNSTFSFDVMWGNGNLVTEFVGQCHLKRKQCEKGTCKRETIETLKLRRSLWKSIDKCQDGLKFMSSEVSTFIRYEQATGPDKAEDVHMSNSTVSASSFFLLLICLLVVLLLLNPSFLVLWLITFPV